MLKALLALTLLVLISASQLQQQTQFNAFKARHNKVYESAVEENERFQIFKKNLLKIETLNAQSHHAKFGVNKFADLDEEEFRQFYLMKPLDADTIVQSCLASGAQAKPEEYLVEDIPASFDWRDQGKVSVVKDQGQCGSCWTFSTTGAIEAAYAIKNNVNATLLLSEQAIVDCSHDCSMVNGQSVCDSGCQGGWPWGAVSNVIEWKGLPIEADYPYTATDGTCQLQGKKVQAAPVNYTCVSGPDQKGGSADEKTLMPSVMMKNGPLSIALNAGMFQFYLGGILDPFFPSFECSPASLDHAVLIVGWGSEDSEIYGTRDYWIVKNSWGASWGESGYIRMRRGEGLCGINNAVMSVLM